MSNNPKCPYCGEEMEPKASTGGRAAITPEEIEKFPWAATHYYECKHCHSRSPFCFTPEEAYAAAMRRPHKCKTYAEDFKEHFGHSWNNKENNWQCRGKLYNDNADCVNSPRCDCEACWNEEMEDEDE